MKKNKYKVVFHMFIVAMILMIFFSRTIYYYSKPKVETIYIKSGYVKVYLDKKLVVDSNEIENYFLELPLVMKSSIGADISHVEKGDEIATFDTSIYLEMISEKENELRSQGKDYIELKKEMLTDESDLRKLYMEKEKAQKELDNLNKLFDDGSVSKENLDIGKEKIRQISESIDLLTKKSNLSINDMNELQLLEESMKFTESKIEKLKEKEVKYRSIKAISSGTILMNSSKIGSEIQANEAFFKIMPDTGVRNVKFEVDIETGDVYEIGDELILRDISYLKSANITCVIKDKNIKADKFEYSAYIKDEVVDLGRVFKLNEVVKKGEFDQIVPVSSVFKKSDGYYVYILDTKDSIMGKSYYVKEIRVNILYKGNSEIAIFSDELNSDSRVVIYSSMELNDNSLVIPKL